MPNQEFFFEFALSLGNSSSTVAQQHPQQACHEQHVVVVLSKHACIINPTNIKQLNPHKLRSSTTNQRLFAPVESHISNGDKTLLAATDTDEDIAKSRENDI